MEKIIERIRKLLALAGNNPSEAEREAAIAKAHQMLVDHNLQMQDVVTTPETVDAHKFGMNSRATPWARVICNHIALLYFCKFIYSVQNKKLVATFVGMKVDAEIARMVSDSVLASVRRQAELHGGSPGSFRNGAAAAIAHRCLKLMKDAAPVNAPGTALVVQSLYKTRAEEAESWVKQNMGPLGKSRSKLNVRYDEAGRAGAAFGQTVSLTAKVRGGP